MASDLLTIAEIAKRLELPESTVRYYRNRFDEYIPSVGEGRSRRYKKEALEVFAVIADGLRNNETATSVKNTLDRTFPRNIDIEDEPQQPMAVEQQQLISGQQAIAFKQAMEEMAAALSRIADQEEEIKNLKEEVVKLHKIQEQQDNERRINESEREKELVERNRWVDEQLRQITERQIAQAEEKKKRTFWQKLLGK